MHTILGAKMIATRFIHLYKTKWSFCIGYLLYVHNLYKKMTPYSRNFSSVCQFAFQWIPTHTQKNTLRKIILHSAFIVLLHTFLYLPPSCAHAPGFQIREFTDSVFYFSLSSQLIFSWGLAADRRFFSLQSSVLGKDRLPAEEEAEKAQKLPGFLPFLPSARTYYDHWQLFWLMLWFCCCITSWGAWNQLSRVTHLSAKVCI